MLWGIGAVAVLFIGLVVVGVPLFVSLLLALAGGAGVTFYVFRRHNPKEP